MPRRAGAGFLRLPEAGCPELRAGRVRAGLGAVPGREPAGRGRGTPPRRRGRERQGRRRRLGRCSRRPPRASASSGGEWQRKRSPSFFSFSSSPGAREVAPPPAARASGESGLDGRGREAPCLGGGGAGAGGRAAGARVKKRKTIFLIFLILQFLSPVSLSHRWLLEKRNILVK